MENKRIVVKIGSNVLSGKDGSINQKRLANIVGQISELHESGLEIIIVSSGAVASGKGILGSGNSRHLTKKLDTVSARQLFSAVGQARLINLYYDLFARHGITCGQVLTTKESFSTRRHYLNQLNCINTMLSYGVIPVVNENDTISVTELMFTDNDELSGMIATMTGAQKLIILSNVDGIFNGNPEEEGTSVIPLIDSERDISRYIRTGSSDFGRGGMQTKYKIARKVSEEGIEVIIANGNRDNIITDLIGNKKDCICTRFIASEKNLSLIKKWIAHSGDFAKGEVTINEGAVKALTGNIATSLLAVGIEQVNGNFEKDDIVRINAVDGDFAAIGRASCGSEELKTVIQKKIKRVFVHYDYLYIEEN